MKERNPIEVRVPLNLIEALKKSVAGRGRHEPVVFGLASHARLRQKTLVLVKRIIPLPPEAYLRDTRHGASWSGRAMIPILNEALAADLGVIIFHAHPHPGKVALSSDD